MKFSELVEAFEAYTGVVGEIDDAEMAVWFNEAQLDLALDFAPIKMEVPAGMHIVNEDLSVGLSSLSYHITRQ